MTFAITILGSTSPHPAKGRFPTAQCLHLHHHWLMIDCGEGAQIRLEEFGIRRSKISHLFISHLHGDHYFGVFGLLGSLRMMRRTAPFHIYAPPDLEEMITLELKISRSAPYPFPIHFHPTTTDGVHILLNTPHFTVHSFPLQHGNIPTTGFLFKEKPLPSNMLLSAIQTYQIPFADMPAIKAGADFRLPNGYLVPNHLLTTPPPLPRSYAFCSDTAYHEPLIPLLQGVDLLYHEATFGSDVTNHPAMNVHSNTYQAATIAAKAAVGRLLIGHFSARYSDLTPLELEARTIFPNTDLALEGKTFEIPFRYTNG